MGVRQGEIWWADLREPRGSEPGFRRPVVVVQDDSYNRSSLATAVCVPLTGNLRLANVLGHVVVPSTVSGLPRDSVALVTQVTTVDQGELLDRVGVLPIPTLNLILTGIEIVLGRA
jgi:mRNA interferase MazF